MKLKIYLFLTLVLLGTSIFATPMTDYVTKANDAYSYKVLKVQITSNQSVSVTHVEFVSQIWQGKEIKNSLQIYYPNTATVKDTALLLFVEGECNNDWLQTASYIAQINLSPVVVVYSTPVDMKDEQFYIDIMKNIFKSDEYFNCPASFLISKTLLKAMDTVGNVTHETYDTPIDNFVLCASQFESLAVYNVAALNDNRVKGIISVAFNNLNLFKQIQSQNEAYGTPSIAYHSQGNKEIKDLNLDKVKSFINLVDPYQYIDSITIPKLIINATNDPHSMIDGAKYYFNDFKGDNNHYYTLVNHDNSKILSSGNNKYNSIQKNINELYVIKTFFYNVVQNKKFEKTKFNWEKTDTGYKLNIDCNENNVKAAYYYVNDAEANDFRYVTWRKKTLEKVNDQYVLDIENPNNVYRCAFVEIQYANENNEPYSEFSIPFVIK